MKKLILFFTTFTLLASAQIIEPVTWDFSQEKLLGKEIELKFKASIDNHWHLYSQHIKEDGPIPTSFVFFESNNFRRSC